MALDTLNTTIPAGTDKIAGRTTPAGFVEGVMVVDPAGAEVDPATKTLQQASNASLANIDADIGTPADAAATDDSGSWSIFALFKRATAALSTLISRIPAISDEAPLPVRLMDSLDGYAPTLPVAGRAPNGANVPIAVNALGGTLPADAPSLITGQASGLNSVLMVIETTGYKSISLHLFGSWSATVQIQGSNTGQDWQPLNSITGNGVAQNIYFNMYAVGIASIPAVTKYVRFVNVAWTSGTVLGAAQLRSVPVQNTQQTPSVNLATVAGTAVSQAGVNGVQAFGGPVAPGVAPGLHNPVQMGGWDGALIRRFLTDTNGAQIVRGPANGAFPNGILQVQETLQGSRAESSTPEALGMIVRELRVTNLILLELSRSLNFGVPITDELEGLRDDMSSLNLN